MDQMSDEDEDMPQQVRFLFSSSLSRIWFLNCKHIFTLIPLYSLVIYLLYIAASRHDIFILKTVAKDFTLFQPIMKVGSGDRLVATTFFVAAL